MNISETCSVGEAAGICFECAGVYYEAAVSPHAGSITGWEDHIENKDEKNL